tara:strand:- start:366 stop:701 length:336 start_codon:yes stop_codon:yes gene_type:complete
MSDPTDIDIDALKKSVAQNTLGIQRNHALETRIQTIAMVLIVGFLSWVGTGLVDVKVGLAQMLSESTSLKNALNVQTQRLAVIESDIDDLQKEMGKYITREELRDILAVKN